MIVKLRCENSEYVIICFCFILNYKNTLNLKRNNLDFQEVSLEISSLSKHLF